MTKQTSTLILISLFVLTCYADFASDCLSAQNAYRTPLNISPLTWSADIASSAQAWAETLAAQESLQHSSSNYGENLACRTGQYSGSVSSGNGGSNANTQNTNSNSQTNSQNNNNYNSNSNSNSNSQSNNYNQNNNNNNNNNYNSNSNSGSNSQNNNNNNWNSNNNNYNNQNGNSNSNNGNSGQSYPRHHHHHNHHNNNNDNGNYNNYDNNNNYNDGGNGDNSNNNQNNRRMLQGSSDTSLVNALVGQWGYEKQYFVYGTFPDVSNSDNTVGHYTQMIWGATTQVGCGIANNDGGWVYFVCQYYPAGNMDGEQVY